MYQKPAFISEVSCLSETEAWRIALQFWLPVADTAGYKLTIMLCMCVSPFGCQATAADNVPWCNRRFVCVCTCVCVCVCARDAVCFVLDTPSARSEGQRCWQRQSEINRIASGRSLAQRGHIRTNPGRKRWNDKRRLTASSDDQPPLMNLRGLNGF